MCLRHAIPQVLVSTTVVQPLSDLTFDNYHRHRCAQPHFFHTSLCMRTHIAPHHTPHGPTDLTGRIPLLVLLSQHTHIPLHPSPFWLVVPMYHASLSHLARVHQISSCKRTRDIHHATQSDQTTHYQSRGGRREVATGAHTSSDHCCVE